jgi:hypothetical protein
MRSYACTNQDHHPADFEPCESCVEIAEGIGCNCHNYTNQVCDICQGITGNEKDTAEPSDFYDAILGVTAVENPKDVIGSNKIPVHLFPQAAVYMGALGNADGAFKYGRNNWRAAEIRYTVYLDAIKRHCDALLESEDEDPESGLNHLCHILATAGIIADAMANDKLVDDRNYTPKPGAWRGFVNKLTPHVKRLREKHGDKSPKHWTSKDNV